MVEKDEPKRRTLPENPGRMSIAFLVLTQQGLTLARAYRTASSESLAIFGSLAVMEPVEGSSGPIPGTLATRFPGEYAWVGSLKGFAPRVWEHFEAIVPIMALGIVFRLFGPMVLDKRRDPGIVVVDDARRFAISVLGGHAGGANALASSLAKTLGAQAVITTASDSHGLPSVDQLGSTDGWVIEFAENLTRVAASVVRREPVAVWQDAGNPGWWRRFGPWPDHFHRLRSWDDLNVLNPSSLLVISDRALPVGLPHARTLVYRPPTLVAGIGCKRGIYQEVIDSWVTTIMREHGLAENSLAAVATVMLKVDEPGLLDFARSRKLPLVAFPSEQISDHPGIETPSERVKAKVGLLGVAEPAALRASGASRLLVPKQKGPGVTLALARKPQPELDPSTHREKTEAG